MSDYEWTQFHVRMCHLALMSDVLARCSIAAGPEVLIYQARARTVADHGKARLR